MTTAAPRSDKGEAGRTQTGQTEDVLGGDAHGLCLEKAPERAGAPVGTLVGGDHRPLDELVRLQVRERGLVVEELDEIRMPGDDLAEPAAGPEEQAEPPRHLR